MKKKLRMAGKGTHADNKVQYKCVFFWTINQNGLYCWFWQTIDRWTILTWQRHILLPCISFRRCLLLGNGLCRRFSPAFSHNPRHSLADDLLSRIATDPSLAWPIVPPHLLHLLQVHDIDIARNQHLTALATLLPCTLQLRAAPVIILPPAIATYTGISHKEGEKSLSTATAQRKECPFTVLSCTHQTNNKNLPNEAKLYQKF